MIARERTRAQASLDDVPGWFPRTDQLVMGALLDHQATAGLRGDLLEMGAYLGKSAILIGRHARPGERFVVCDLFGTEAETAENKKTAAFYRTLSREAFEANYLAFHDRLPEIVQAPTSMLVSCLAESSFRFVHIDACHLYRHVVEDLETSRRLLADGGLVVCDDIRTLHTPGVAAAVWPLVHSGELRPVVLTPNKLYATWSDPEPARHMLLEWLAPIPATDLRREVLLVADQQMLRIWPGPDWQECQQRSRVRRIAVDLLPPALIRQLRRSRR
jgi:predicted O-methyltransferase YrrM